MLGFKIILYLNNSLLFLCFILGIFRLRYLNSREKWYVYYAIFLFFIEATTKLFVYFYGLKNMAFLYPVYIAGEFIVLNYLYTRKNNFSSYWIIPLSVLGIIFLATNQYFNFNIDNDYIKVVSNIVIICFAGYTLVQEIKGRDTVNRFLLVDACIFFYYSVSVFTFIVQHQLADISEQNASLIWGINNLLSSVVYGSLIYTFLRLKK